MVKSAERLAGLSVVPLRASQGDVSFVFGCSSFTKGGGLDTLEVFRSTAETSGDAYEAFHEELAPSVMVGDGLSPGWTIILMSAALQYTMSFFRQPLGGGNHHCTGLYGATMQTRVTLGVSVSASPPSCRCRGFEMEAISVPFHVGKEVNCRRRWSSVPIAVPGLSGSRLPGILHHVGR